MSVGINPGRGKIAVDPIFERNTYESSVIELIKPDQYKGRSTQGIVKYVGDEVRDITVGDYVFFSAYTGTLWEVKGELLIFMNANGVKAKRDMSQDERIVPGLYFKGVVDYSEMKNKLAEKLFEIPGVANNNGIITSNDLRDIIEICRPQYWEANYAQCITLIAQSIDDPIMCTELNPNDPENFLDEDVK